MYNGMWENVSRIISSRLKYFALDPCFANESEFHWQLEASGRIVCHPLPPLIYYCRWNPNQMMSYSLAPLHRSATGQQRERKRRLESNIAQLSSYRLWVQFNVNWTIVVLYWNFKIPLWATATDWILSHAFIIGRFLLLSALNLQHKHLDVHHHLLLCSFAFLQVINFWRNYSDPIYTFTF